MLTVSRLLTVCHWLLAVGLGLLTVGLGLLTVGLGLLTVGCGGLGDNYLSLRSVVLLVKEYLLFHLALAALAHNTADDRKENENGKESPEDPSVLAPAVVAAVVVVILVASGAIEIVARQTVAALLDVGIA